MDNLEKARLITFIKKSDIEKNLERQLTKHEILSILYRICNELKYDIGKEELENQSDFICECINLSTPKRKREDFKQNDWSPFNNADSKIKFDYRYGSDIQNILKRCEPIIKHSRIMRKDWYAMSLFIVSESLYMRSNNIEIEDIIEYFIEGHIREFICDLPFNLGSDHKIELMNFFTGILLNS
jgi:hypothetical protein